MEPPGVVGNSGNVLSVGEVVARTWDERSVLGTHMQYGHTNATRRCVRESFQRGTGSQFNCVDLVGAMLAHRRCHD